MRANPSNAPDALEIAGVGILQGQGLGSTSAWNAPDSILTPMGEATRSGMTYVMPIPMVQASRGDRYHVPGCEHAGQWDPARMVPVATASALGYSSCEHCNAAFATMVVAELREPRKRNYSALYAVS